MKSWQLVAVVAFCMTSITSQAATLTISIDGESASAPVTQLPKVGGTGSLFLIGPSEDEAFTFETNNGRVVLGGILDPDPQILFGSAVFDFGAPSIFGYTLILPLAPTFPNPSVVFDSFAGSVTNSTGADVTVTALAPPAGVPVDGDGITEMQVFTLSDDGGLTWKNVGLDLGPSASFPLGVGGSDTYGPFAAGPIPTIAGGPWTHMRADINFMLSGGGDIFSFNGSKELVPEPGTFVLGLVSLAVASVLGRSRAARRQ